MAWYIVFRKNDKSDVAILYGKKAKNQYARNAPFENYPAKDACINRAKQLGYSYAIIVDKQEEKQNNCSTVQLVNYKEDFRTRKVEIYLENGKVTLKRPKPYIGQIDNYKKYLESQHWKQMRHIRIVIDEGICQMCGARSNLQVHHLTYDRIGNEKLSDLITLCEKCHKKIHAE